MGLILLLTSIGAGVRAAAAHGGGDLIARSVEAGPYIVSIWVNPPEPRAAEAIHFTVGLADPQNESPILDADIAVLMRFAEDETIAAEARATTDQSINKLFYETDIEVPAQGAYTAAFQISGPRGEGVVVLPVDVRPASRINWLAVGFAGLALVLVGGYWRSRRAASKETPE